MKFAQIFGASRPAPLGWGARSAKKSGKARDATQTRRQLLALRPMRNPKLEWLEEDGRVVLKIPARQLQGWKLKLLNLIFPLPIAPADRHVELDRIGTDVWNMVDGTHTFGQIALALAEKYQLVPREAEMQLQQFFKEIGRRGYIMFPNESAGSDDAKQVNQKPMKMKPEKKKKKR